MLLYTSRRTQNLGHPFHDHTAQKNTPISGVFFCGGEGGSASSSSTDDLIILAPGTTINEALLIIKHRQGKALVDIP